MIRFTHDSFSWNSFSRPIIAHTPQPHSQMTYPLFCRRVALYRSRRRRRRDRVLGDVT